MALLTNKFNINLANTFVESIAVPSIETEDGYKLTDEEFVILLQQIGEHNLYDNYYVTCGTPQAFANDADPPSVNNNINVTELTAYDNLLWGKKIEEDDIEFVARRTNWTSNTVYAQYDHTDSYLASNNYFVVTDENKVYKCLYNNKGNVSTAKPQSVLANGSFTTSDDYRWKYLYTISSADMTKFATEDFIPIKPNVQVTSNAVGGTIDVIQVVSGGESYSTYDSGSIQGITNSTIVSISNTASSDDNYYTDGVIYINDGFGAGQLRTIIEYDGASRAVTVNSALTTYYTMTLDSNLSGTFGVGETLTQSLQILGVTSVEGSFQPGDSITQSDSGATATVIAANTTALIIRATGASFSNNLPVDGGDGSVTQTGTVACNTTSANITGTGTSFTTEYDAGEYIKIQTQFRRITSVTNTTSLVVASAFGIDAASNTHSKVTTAADIVNITDKTTSGTIIYSDTDSVTLTLANTQGSFTAGELINQSVTNANGIIGFANTTKMIVVGVTGTFANTPSYTVTGLTSTATAYPTLVEDSPKITVSSSNTLPFVVPAIVNTTVGTANTTAISRTPDVGTSYTIAPGVSITGDGTGAQGYCVVNATTNAISTVHMISIGNGYTTASATVVANTIYGSGANLKPLIAPISGHGGDVPIELNANTVMINVVFDRPENESYVFPGYGTFRSVGILKNPVYANTGAGNTRFTQLGRLALNGDGDAFTVGEVVTQSGTGANGIVFSTNNEVDLLIDSVANGPFVFGESIVQTTTNANGVVLWSNTTYLKITGVNGTFQSNLDITGSTSTATANTANVYPVIVIAGVRGTFSNNGSLITGTDSSSIDSTTLANAYSLPDLSINSGDVIYIDNIEPITKRSDSTETFNLVLKF